MRNSGHREAGFLTQIGEEISEEKETNAVDVITNLIQPDQYVGDLLTLDYETADILIHDSHRVRVNGIPFGCLLIASRITPDGPSVTDPTDGRASLLLLRVSGSARLNSDIDLNKTRFEIVQRSNDTEQNYDDAKQTDQFTLNLLRYAGVQCRVLGTFRLYQTESNSVWQLHFGADIDNFNAGQGMKIYKPNGESLSKIVNYRSNGGNQPSNTRIGCLRYSASNRDDKTPESVPIEIAADDFIAQRTALFGMTRTGKSNTTKTIAAALFKLRLNHSKMRVGQLIFDPNGEYANDNPQDQGCIRNLKYENSNFADDVHTYGSYKHPFDKGRHITKFNFFGEYEPLSPPSKEVLDSKLRTLYQGKQIINDALAEENAGYIKAFCNADLTTEVEVRDHGEYKRLRRRLFVYRSILAESGFDYTGRANVNGLFREELRNLMAQSEDLKQYVPLLNSGEMEWEVAGNFVKELAKWVTANSFKKFDSDYATSHDGRNWSDSHFLGLLRFYDDTRARSVAQSTRVWHDLSSTADYADAIVDQVRDGKLVIVDQLLGDPVMNRQAAERIARRLFQEQQRSFSQPTIDSKSGEIVQPPPVIVYAEEAHTLLPKTSEDDSNNIWARIAKEGAKFNIGMVYSTQEPSSLQTNILKNTENWFIAHLNNTDETNQISKFNDFDDFKSSIINVAEAGLIKIRTHSSYFTVPVHMDLFKAPTAPRNGQDQETSNDSGEQKGQLPS
ncbi:MAG: DUF87 domain-containing protein [Gemmatimonadetes bacterium]|nr:DUF87 domain-containing protein [Gemmatimonadota bacterium]